MPAMDALADLDPEQTLVAEALTGPVVVLAGAGTGKTRAITHRIAHACQTGAHDPATGLAVTFTNRAAGEMRQRLLGQGVPGVAVRTFHAAALSQLRHFWPSAIGGSFPELVASKARLVTQACRELGMRATPAAVRDLAAEIEWAGSSMVGPTDYETVAERVGRTSVGAGADEVEAATIAHLMAAYDDVKRQANVIDFEDVLLTLVALLGERPDVADEVRRRYRWFTVDEYQDITPVQEQLLGAWLGDRDDVCVVGDASQTIYSFAGASPDSLGRFTDRWPHATEIRLARCYRCTPQIVAVANALITSRSRRGPGADPGTTGPVILQSTRPDGPAPDIVTCADDADEARTVVTRIEDLVSSGTAHRDIAILMRTNGASEPLEVALGEAGIPFVMRGAERFFERPEVREAVVRLRGEAQPARARPRRSDGDLVERVVAVLSGMGWRPSGPIGEGASRERWESLAAVVALAAELAAGGATSLADLITELDRRASIAHAPTPDGVTVATLHAAKGLEWPVVFIVGCAEGSIPIVHATTPARIAEERRLLYVGLTRARDRVIVTWALTRAGSGRQREPSRFLAELRAGGRVSAARSPSGLMRRGQSQATRDRDRRPPGRCRVCGAGLVTAPERTLGRCRTCPGVVDEQVMADLRAWRLETARDQEVPDCVVLTDVTLTALAERRPRDSDELLDIPGIGRAKAARYGERLLSLVSAEGSEGDDAPAEGSASPAEGSARTE